MEKSTFTLILLLLTMSLWSQALSQIGGQILSETHEEVVSATILLRKSIDSTLVKAWTSDLDGTYTLDDIPAGAYFLEVICIGFEDFSGEIFEVQDGEDLAVPTIFISTKMEMLEEVIVKAARPIIEVRPNKTVFNIDGNINATASDAFELLRKAPGVLIDNNDKLMLLGRSGVRIYIDDKPTHLSTDDLANYLKSMPSTEIEAIEIITNPSAKYDAAGNAGIINIRLKKDKNLGLNVDLNTSYSIGTYAKYNNAFNSNFRRKNLNIYGQYGHSIGNWTNYNIIDREQAGMTFDQTAKMRGDYLNHRYRIGVDYSLTYKSTLGILFNGYNNAGSFHNNSVVDIAKTSNGEILSKLYASNDIDQTRDNLTLNLNYSYNDGMGSKFNIDADAGRFQNDGISWQPNRYMDSNNSELITERIFSSLTPTTISIYTLKMDLEKPLWGGQLAVGGKFSSVLTDNTYDFFDVIEHQKVKNLDRSNQFEYVEQVGAMYTSYQRQIARWNLSLGLRVENTSSRSDLTSEKLMLSEKVDRNYLDWFPSGGLTFQMNEKNMLRFNYSRRLDRPSYQDLNPFEFKLDELTFLKGNAFLNPQYANNFSISHTLNSKLNTTLNYSITKDLITRINDTLNTDATFITFVNLDRQKVISLGVSYPFTITKWWNVFANLSAYQTTNKANFAPGKLVDITAFGINTYAQNTFSLPKDFRLEVSGFYRSPFIWEANFQFDAMYTIDLGLRKKLLKDRATLKIAVTDVFNTHKVHGSNQFGELKMAVWSGWESRQLRVNFNYLLGNRKIKGQRNRVTGIEDEQKRIKTENLDP